MTAVAHLPFEFADRPPHGDASSFVLEVPAGIRSKADLLATLSNRGKFPSYFGMNWDALDECLRDLSWIEQAEVALMHADLPLDGDDRNCRAYLEVLRDAALDWSRPDSSRSFHVVFLRRFQRRIETLLARSADL